jgi:hypothetical protein
VRRATIRQASGSYLGKAFTVLQKLPVSTALTLARSRKSLGANEFTSFFQSASIYRCLFETATPSS